MHSGAVRFLARDLIDVNDVSFAVNANDFANVALVMTGDNLKRTHNQSIHYDNMYSVSKLRLNDSWKVSTSAEFTFVKRAHG